MTYDHMFEPRLYVGELQAIAGCIKASAALALSKSIYVIEDMLDRQQAGTLRSSTNYGHHVMPTCHSWMIIAPLQVWKLCSEWPPAFHNACMRMHVMQPALSACCRCCKDLL